MKPMHRTLQAFFHDFAHGVLHFEGKIWRTLPLLVWKPGELTRRYIDGQRARFVSPIALFLFCVFLMFAVVGLTSSSAHVSQESRTDAAKELGKDQQKLAILQQQRTIVTGAAASALDEKISDLKDEMTTLQAVKEARSTPAFTSPAITWAGSTSNSARRRRTPSCCSTRSKRTPISSAGR